MKTFWLECRRAFKGIVTLKKNGVIHNDLKPQNIVYDMKKKRLNFIDFGLMMFSKDIKKMCEESKYYSDNLHWSYPPEIIFMNKQKFEEITKNSPNRLSIKEKKYKDFVDDVENDQDGHINYFMEVTETSFGQEINYLPKNASKNSIIHTAESEGSVRLLDMIKQHIDDFYTMLFTDIDQHSREEFINKVLNTMDVYGLAVTLIYVLHRTSYLIPDETANELNSLFLEMLHFNVFERIGPEEAKQKFDKIITRLPASF